VQSDGPSARSLTEQKNRNLRILPADGTIAARVAHWEFGISRWQLENRLDHFGGSGKTVTTPPEVSDGVSWLIHQL
jgi:hypothetical protein